ncbi:MAG: endonuclease III [Candidatus Sabulitectum sp.]|nr:endonuclease III [Candidatus Sabulitectum sp.]
MIKNLTPRKLLETMSQSIGEPGLPSPLVAGADPFFVLVGTIISLRTRDAVTEVVTRRVLASTPSLKKLAVIPVEELAELLHPAGFFNRKAVQLKKVAEILLRDYNGEIPADRKALESLPGVGGKTAAYVLSMAFRIPAICVDVHVHRIGNRMGIIETASPDESEKALMEYFPEELWIPLNHIFVRFGQRICLPRNPKCSECIFKGWCKYAH